MSVIAIIINALVPIAFVIILGVLAGRTGTMKSEESGVLANLALDFCLPSLLFVSTATMSLAEFGQWRFFLGIAIGLLAVYLAAMAVALALFRKPMADSSLQALNASFPNMAFMGIPVLTAIVGAGATLSVVVGNLVSSFVLIPLTLTLLAAGSDKEKGRKPRQVVTDAVLAAVKKPLVWGPLAGIALALLHIPLPSVAQRSFSLIGEATSGVALFSMGLLLSGRQFRISIPSLTNVGFKVLVQPAAMWGVALLLGVTGLARREMILLGALPTASMTAMFAVQYQVYTEDSDATIVVSTVLSIISLAVLIALTA